MHAAPRTPAFGVVAIALVAILAFLLHRVSEHPGSDANPGVPRAALTPSPATDGAVPDDSLPDPGASSRADPRALDTLLPSSEGTRELDPARLAETIDCALDPACDLVSRVRAIRWLARSGDDEAFEVLERLLQPDSNPTLRREAAAALGECPRPDAELLIDRLLEDDELVGGAIRALATRGDRETLETLLLDTSRAAWIRGEAAIALGKQGDASARAVLLQALASSEDDELTAGLLRGLAAKDLGESADLFRSLLADPGLPRARKLDALAAIAEGSRGADDLLLEVAHGAGDEQLRETAIESLARVDEPSGFAASLGALLASEPSADVRAAVYRTLAARADPSMAPEDLDALLPPALVEQAPVARREAYRMVAVLSRRDPDPRIARIFDESMVPWLQREAERGATSHARRASLGALGTADTPAARAALLDLTHADDDEIAAAAQRIADRREERNSRRLP